MQLWAVTGTVPVGARPPAAAAVYAVAMSHGVSYIDSTVALSRINARERRSLAARMFAWGGYFETGATVMVNLRVIAASSQVSIGLNVAMSIVNSLLPAIQKDIPIPDPSIVAKTGSLLMDGEGTISGLFWAEPSQVAGFTDTLP